MPLLTFLGVGNYAPAGLFDAVAEVVSGGLSIPPERVWAVWQSVDERNIRRVLPVPSLLAPICVMYCRSNYARPAVSAVLERLRDTIANVANCSSAAVFVAVQRVQAGELMSFGAVWNDEVTADGFQMRSIGRVCSSIREPEDDCWGGHESAIELDELTFGPESLAGLDEFSHVDVIFVFHRVSESSVERAARHPRGRTDLPVVGIFAQRAKHRPNRIGVTTCEIVRVAGTRLIVKELDAIDGTPVIDIKPHMREFEPRTSVRQPSWSREIMGSYFNPPKRS